MPWISVLIAPAATNTDHYTTRSKALQGLFKDGTQAVVRWYPQMKMSAPADGKPPARQLGM